MTLASGFCAALASAAASASASYATPVDGPPATATTAMASSFSPSGYP
jgi:hypothetical protein